MNDVEVRVSAVPDEIRRQVLKACALIKVGATFNALESAGIISTRSFLEAVERDEDLFLEWSGARAISAFYLEDQITSLLREATRAPHSNSQLRALDMLQDHVKWQTAVRNPAKFSPKAALKISVPIQINTTLDLAGDQMADVYNLTAEVIKEVPLEDVPDEVLANPDEHFANLVAKGHDSEGEVRPKALETARNTRPGPAQATRMGRKGPRGAKKAQSRGRKTPPTADGRVSKIRNDAGRKAEEAESVSEGMAQGTSGEKTRREEAVS